jgi:hypothetical protein
MDLSRYGVRFGTQGQTLQELSTGSIFRSYKKRFTKSHVRYNQIRGHGYNYTNEVLGSSLIIYIT